MLQTVGDDTSLLQTNSNSKMVTSADSATGCNGNTCSAPQGRPPKTSMKLALLLASTSLLSIWQRKPKCLKGLNPLPSSASWANVSSQHLKRQNTKHLTNLTSQTRTKNECALLPQRSEYCIEWKSGTMSCTALSRRSLFHPLLLHSEIQTVDLLSLNILFLSFQPFCGFRATNLSAWLTWSTCVAWVKVCHGMSWFFLQNRKVTDG